PSPLPFPFPLPLPWLPLFLSLPLPLPWFSRALLALCSPLTSFPCWLANALTHLPMPRVPEARKVSLHVATACFTCCPQSAGFRLPVTATSVAAPAAEAASAATANPVTALAAIAAPAPPRILFILPPDKTLLRRGIDDSALIGSRAR